MSSDVSGIDASHSDDRDETPTERLDRNWSDLLQELRVVQTGVQFLTGFLLTLPFQQRFSELNAAERNVYLATVSASITATALLQTPISVHRALFRRHERGRAVAAAHRLSVAGLFFLACAIVGVTFTVFAVLTSDVGGICAAAVCALLLTALWLVFPRMLRHRPKS